MNAIFYRSICLLFFIKCSLAYCQVIDIEFYKKKYPNKAFVYLSKTSNFELQVKDKKLTIIKKYKEQKLLLTDAAKSIDTRKVSTSQFIEVKNVKARVLVPNNKKYDKIEVTSVSLAEEGSDESFYDGEKQYIVKFPSTLPGNILEIEYEELYNEPRFFGSVFLSDYYPTISSIVTIKNPASINLTIKNINNQDLKSVFTKSIKKNDSIYTWSFDTIQPLPLESYSPNIKYYASYILLKVQDYKNEDGTIIPILRNTDDIYQWYSELVKNLNKTEDQHLKKLTDSLTTGITSNLDKMTKIFYWVQDKIAYVAYEDGLGGFIPREASVICKRRFGDCKDMSSLIVKMGQLANLNVHLTWIGTRAIPYNFSDFPSPFCADHMIATYIDDGGNYVFLDGTGKLGSFGIPTSMIQGKEAFVSLSEKEYKLIKVPIIESKNNYITDSIICSIKANKILGYGYFKTDGYSKVNITRRINNKSPRELKEYFTALFNKGNNKFSIDSFAIIQQVKELPLIIYYKFTLPDYVVNSDKNTFVNLNFDKDYLKDLKSHDRITPIEFNFCSAQKMLVTLNINKGESIDYYPEVSSGKFDVGRYKSKYTVNTNSVYFENEVYLDQLFMKPEIFTTLNKFVTSYSTASNKSLSIKKQ